MIIIKGNYGNGNTGDDALAYCVYNEIKNRKYSSYLLYKKTVSNCYDIPSLPFTITPNDKFSKIVDLVKYSHKADTLIYGGGSQIQLAKGINNILYTVKFMKQMGTKVFFVGIGVEEISTDKKYLKALNQIINYCDYFSVRDLNSYNIASNLNINKPVYFSSDPCVNFYELSDVSIGKKDKKTNQINIAIIPMDYDVLYVFVDQIIKTIKDNFASCNIKFNVLPFAKVDDYAVNKLCNFLKAKNDKNVDVQGHEFTHNLYDVLGPLKNTDYIISGRLHGGIVGALLEKPVIYCASETRNNQHNKNLGISIGYKNENFVSNSKDAKDIVNDYILNPERFIRDNKSFNEAKNRLKLDYDRIINLFE